MGLAMTFGVVCFAAAPLALESVAVEGSKVSKDAVISIAGLHIGGPIDKAAIEEGCKRLQETGLFTSVQYGYRPGPKQGYAVTLTLQDSGPLTGAAIDIPDADEAALWKWMMSLYPAFDHRVPGGAQDFLAGQIEKQASARLNGQHVVARQEANLETRGTLISFQPENLPQVSWVAFEGEHAMAAQDLKAVIDKVLPGFGYTERGFRFLVEKNVRPAYEDLGMYRVQFPAVHAQKTGASTLGVTVTIAERPVYSLGQVDPTGDNLPPDLTNAGNFPIGKAANWTLIQKGIWAMQSRMVTAGYLDAAAGNERVFDDQNKVLNVRVKFRTGPLYHFGQVTFTGLPPHIESVAQSTWSKSSGDPYDFRYPELFVRELSKQADLRAFKYKVEPTKNANATVDMKVVFTSRQ